MGLRACGYPLVYSSNPITADFQIRRTFIPRKPRSFVSLPLSVYRPPETTATATDPQCLLNLRQSITPHSPPHPHPRPRYIQPPPPVRQYVISCSTPSQPYQTKVWTRCHHRPLRHSVQLVRVGVPYGTPLLLGDSPTLTTLKHASNSAAFAPSSSKADYFNNRRAKPFRLVAKMVEFWDLVDFALISFGLPIFLIASTTLSLFQRFPAFASNDRQLPRALALRVSPSTSTVLSPKHWVPATSCDAHCTMPPPSNSSLPLALLRAPVLPRRGAVAPFNRSNLEALTVIARAVPGTIISECEDDILEDDAHPTVRIAAATPNVSSNTKHLNSSDSDLFIRMDRDLGIQPRTPFQD